MSAVVLLTSGAHAAGLGKLTVLSSLGQPLRAEIELTSVTKEEAGSLTARLAPMEAYRQANIDFNPALQSLQFSIEQRNGRQFIRLSSSQPINEPFVDMLLELGTNNSRLMREYTFLLDPAEVKTSQAPQTIAPASPAGLAQSSSVRSAAPPAAAAARPAVPQAASQAEPAAPPAQPSPAQSAATSAPAAPARPQASSSTGEYRVKSGDSLAKIAAQVKADAVSLDQMLVSLFSANPEAFAGRNMNRLRAGEILKVPDAQTAGAVSSREARQIIRAQAADFNAYRNRLAGQVATGQAKRSAQDAQTATGKITSSVDESASSVDAAQDKLKLSRAGAAGAATGPGTVSSEEVVAKDKALSESNDRVRELEKNLADLQALLQIKSRELTERQQQAEAANAGLAKGSGSSSDGNPSVKQEAESEAVSGAASNQPGQAAEGAAAPAANAAAPGQNTPAPAATIIPQSPSPQAAKPPTPPAKSAAVEPSSETSFLNDLLSSPMLLPAAGFLTLALGAFGAYQRRRRKPASRAADTGIGAPGLKANSLFASTGGQSVDTSNSVFNSSFSPSASQLDANEVDPVAEADVYIAYGRDAQAEEILREALRGQPERHAVRLKLLEIYAGRKDVRAFETHATELYGQTKGQGDEWQQALRLGRSIDPRNPLYGGARDTSDIDSKIADAEAILGGDDESRTPAKLAMPESLPEASLREELLHADIAPETFIPEDKEKRNALSETKEPPADLLPPLDMPTSAAGRNEAVEAESAKPLHDAMAMQDAVEETPEPLSPSAASFNDQLSSLSFELNNFPAGAFTGEDSKTSEIEVTESITIDSLDFDLDAPVVSKSAVAPISDDDVPVLTATTLERPDGHGEDRADGSSLAAADAISASPRMGDMMDFDLSGIDLDLPGKNADASSGVQSSPGELEADGTGNPEMATKLDLAAAYQEIGDKEGARELLDEVIQGGTPGQIAEARRMLEKLA